MYNDSWNDNIHVLFFFTVITVNEVIFTVMIFGSPSYVHRHHGTQKPEAPTLHLLKIQFLVEPTQFHQPKFISFLNFRKWVNILRRLLSVQIRIWYLRIEFQMQFEWDCTIFVESWMGDCYWRHFIYFMPLWWYLVFKFFWCF